MEAIIRQIQNIRAKLGNLETAKTEDGQLIAKLGEWTRVWEAAKFLVSAPLFDDADVEIQSRSSKVRRVSPNTTYVQTIDFSGASQTPGGQKR